MVTPTSTEFAFTGDVQTYVVPANVRRIQIEVWGAQGNGSGAAGLGGYAVGTLDVTPGQELGVYVGGRSGFNGGGVRTTSGGGASDVRTAATLASRVIVAGGGGANGASGAAGGAGGGTTGGDGGVMPSGGTGPARGGTQAAGGAAGTGSHSSSPTAGTLGQGGLGGTWIYDQPGGGGGGGYYGGGGGSASQSSGAGGQGGAGGSGYIGGVTSGSMTSGVRSGNGLAVITTVNMLPLAPTLEFPTTVNKDVDTRFRFVHNDPDGDGMQGFEFRYRVQGTSSWTTETVESPNQWYDVPAGTFTSDSYEGQVRTKDAEGYGPWSSLASWTAGEAPAGPSITDPIAGGTISQEDHDVAWSAAEQDDYQLRVVADDGGVPDTSNVIFDTGTVSSSARSLSVNFPTNGVVRHIQVRVRRSGLWSEWASVDVTVSYTAPASPSAAVAVHEVTLAGRTVEAALDVSGTHPSPSGSEPSVTHMDVYRRVVGDDGDGIRVCADCSPSGTFTDWSVASGVDYEYRLRAYGDNGTSSYSGWVADAGDDPDPVDITWADYDMTWAALSGTWAEQGAS